MENTESQCILGSMDLITLELPYMRIWGWNSEIWLPFTPGILCNWGFPPVTLERWDALTIWSLNTVIPLKHMKHTVQHQEHSKIDRKTRIQASTPGYVIMHAHWLFTANNHRASSFNLTTQVKPLPKRNVFNHTVLLLQSILYIQT